MWRVKKEIVPLVNIFALAECMRLVYIYVNAYISYFNLFTVYIIISEIGTDY